MAKLAQCRLLMETEPRSGAWNMAVDEVLLDSAVTEGRASFRWYRWSEPTLSLGYFQNVAEIDADPKWANVPKVRRLTGGGAILHHYEWTYSLALPARHALCRLPEELYDVIHLAMIDLLRTRGCEARLRGETISQPREPILCFSRSDTHDVVLRGHKILGSAQRRRKGAILQHGSLLWQSSPWTPQFPGVRDLCPLELDWRQLASIPTGLAERIGNEELSTSEQSSAARIETEIRGSPGLLHGGRADVENWLEPPELWMKNS